MKLTPKALKSNKLYISFENNRNNYDYLKTANDLTPRFNFLLHDQEHGEPTERSR